MASALDILSLAALGDEGVLTTAEPEQGTPVVSANPEPVVASPLTADVPESASLAVAPETPGPSAENPAPPVANDTAEAGRPVVPVLNENEKIRCLCQFEHDDGFTIQCDRCQYWQHTTCVGINFDAAPDNYLCDVCDPQGIVDRKVDRRKATEYQREIALKLAPVQATTVPARKTLSRSSKKRIPDMSEATDEPTVPPSAPRTNSKRRVSSNNASASGGHSRAATDDTAAKLMHASSYLDDEGDDSGEHLWQMEYTPANTVLLTGPMLDRIHNAVLQAYRTQEKRRIRSGHVGDLAISMSHKVSPLPVCIRTIPASQAFHIHNPANSSFLPVPQLQFQYQYFTSSTLSQTPHLSPHYTTKSYGIFAVQPIAPGSFIGNMTGELTTILDYIKNPINQYDTLGVPKRFVHFLPQPFGLALDARKCGNELRYVRNGCHPNVEIKVVSHPNRSISFGLYSTGLIGKKEELILPWDWDDHHLIHTIPKIIDTALHEPNVVLSHSLLPDFCRRLALISASLLSNYPTCSCYGRRKEEHCLLTYLTRLAGISVYYNFEVPLKKRGRDRLEKPERKENKESFNQVLVNVLTRDITASSKPGFDLGPLIGAKRGFFRGESPEYLKTENDVEMEDVDTEDEPRGIQLLKTPLRTPDARRAPSRRSSAIKVATEDDGILSDASDDTIILPKPDPEESEILDSRIQVTKLKKSPKEKKAPQRIRRLKNTIEKKRMCEESIADNGVKRPHLSEPPESPSLPTAENAKTTSPHMVQPILAPLPVVTGHGVEIRDVATDSLVHASPAQADDAGLTTGPVKSVKTEDELEAERAAVREAEAAAQAQAREEAEKQAQLETERLAKLESERLAKEEAERVEAERLETERLEAEKQAQLEAQKQAELEAEKEAQKAAELEAQKPKEPPRARVSLAEYRRRLKQLKEQEPEPKGEVKPDDDKVEAKDNEEVKSAEEAKTKPEVDKVKATDAPISATMDANSAMPGISGSEGAPMPSTETPLVSAVPTLSVSTTSVSPSTTGGYSSFPSSVTGGPMSLSNSAPAYTAGGHMPFSTTSDAPPVSHHMSVSTDFGRAVSSASALETPLPYSAPAQYNGSREQGNGYFTAQETDDKQNSEFKRESSFPAYQNAPAQHSVPSPAMYNRRSTSPPVMNPPLSARAESRPMDEPRLSYNTPERPPYRTQSFSSPAFSERDRAPPNRGYGPPSSRPYPSQNPHSHPHHNARFSARGTVRGGGRPPFNSYFRDHRDSRDVLSRDPRDVPRDSRDLPRDLRDLPPRDSRDLPPSRDPRDLPPSRDPRDHPLSRDPRDRNDFRFRRGYYRGGRH